MFQPHLPLIPHRPAPLQLFPIIQKPSMPEPVILLPLFLVSEIRLPTPIGEPVGHIAPDEAHDDQLNCPDDTHYEWELVRLLVGLVFVYLDDYVGQVGGADQAREDGQGSCYFDSWPVVVLIPILPEEAKENNWLQEVEENVEDDEQFGFKFYYVEGVNWELPDGECYWKEESAESYELEGVYYLDAKHKSLSKIAFIAIFNF